MNKWEIRRLEELGMNAWVPLKTQLLNGWVLRFAEGYTKRANSVSPLYETDKEIEKQIESCERIYRQKGQKTIFKLTEENSLHSLDTMLSEKGYEAIDHTSVQLCDLEKRDYEKQLNVKIYQNREEEWILDFCRISNKKTEEMPIIKEMLLRIPSDVYFCSIEENGKVIACGMGVLEEKFVGVFDIVTDIEYRRQGFGEKIVTEILRLGKEKGATKAYLQVVDSNEPAKTLYNKLGFQETYKYWYRVK